jgi:putative endonuclease
MRHLLLGKKGERHAARYLKRIGFKVLAMNYRTAGGEIDIIAREKDILAFVEVKTRTTASYGIPQEAVDLRKQRQLIRAARAYLQEIGETSIPCRFDVVAVQAGKDGRQKKVELIRDAFDASGF